MNFGLTEEQQILTNVARRFIEERAPIAKVRDVMESPSGFDPASGPANGRTRLGRP